MAILVHSRGPKTSKVMIVGEAPGREEASRGRPFVGKSGQEQDWYLSRYGLHSATCYVTNVVKEYREGNPDPTPDQLREWTPVLEAEIEEVHPLLIIAVGRFAVRWFLGERADMETVHGLPHHAGAFDPSRKDRARGAIVVPVYHPAFGMYDGEMRAVIAWDYGQACRTWERLDRGQEVTVPHDEFAGQEQYLDVTGAELEFALRGGLGADAVLALDTEGRVTDPWSVQVSLREGAGMILRRAQKDFQRGVVALQQAADAGVTFAIHNAMYDVAVCRALGLNLSNARLWDTMYAAYLLRLEPQGLKPLAYRWTGAHMTSYDETVGEAGKPQQAEYLCRVLERDWPKPEGQLVLGNDGSARLYTPQSVNRRAESLLVDMHEDETVDPWERWRTVDEGLRAQVEAELGPMPRSGLDNLDLDAAVRYSVRDADVTLRVYYRLLPVLTELDLLRTMDDGMSVLPVFEEMQATGMLASRSQFAALTDEVDTEMARLQSRISNRYYGGKPFNPASSKQVAAVMRRRGLTAEKRTSTGAMSTGKKSIEHLRFRDEAIAAIIDWRECQKIRDAFCKPALERSKLYPPDVDLFPVRCQIKTTRVATRRLAAADPNLLQIPTRHELGKKVRGCYVAPPGEVYGSWDLSQIEMRYMAHESRDARLCELFLSGRDVHTETAAAIFKLPLDQVDEMKHRYPAKRAGFGILYGISGGGLYDQLRMMSETGVDEWSPEKCDDLIKRWLEVYDGVAKYIQQVGKEVGTTGYVRDRWGMYRYLPGIWSPDLRLRAEAGRIAVSHRIQGGAQGMIQRSIAYLRPQIAELQRAGLNVRWVLQIHDEIILRFDEDLWDVVDPMVQDALTHHHGVEDMRVPVKASGHKSASWGTLK